MSAKAAAQVFSARHTIHEYALPAGVTWTWKKMDRINVDDLKLPPEVFALRLKRRAQLRDAIEEAMPDIDKAVANYNLDDYYKRALELIVSGRARNAFDLHARNGQDAAMAMDATHLAKAVCLHVVSSKPALASSKSSGPKSPTPTIIPGTTTSI